MDQRGVKPVKRDSPACDRAEIDALQRRMIGRLCIAACGFDERLDRELVQITTAVRQDCDAAQLQGMIDRLSRAVALLPERHSITAAGPFPVARLLERLHFAGPLESRAAALRARIQLPGCDPITVAEDLAGLLGEQQTQDRVEKTQAQQLLLQVTARLDDMAAYLQTAARDQRSAEDSGRELDTQVRSEMRALNEQARSARALEELQQQVQGRLEQISQHLHSHRTEERNRWQEQRLRTESMRLRIEELESATSKLRESAERGQQLAMTDALTGIPNRLAYDERVRARFASSARTGAGPVIAVFDIDYFKRINDRWGHPCGDRLLRVVATVLSRNVRKDDFVARYGGEEFVVMLDGLALDAAARRVDALRKMIERIEFRVGDAPVPVTVSCGIAEATAGETAEAAFERADQALYRAKNKGRNCCETA